MFLLVNLGDLDFTFEKAAIGALRSVYRSGTKCRPRRVLVDLNSSGQLNHDATP